VASVARDVWLAGSDFGVNGAAFAVGGALSHHTASMARAKKPPKAAKPPKWAGSKAKELLCQDIIKGKCVGNNRTVCEMRVEHEPCLFTNFSQNLKRLREHIAKEQERADQDAADLAHDESVRPRPLMDPRGCPRWDVSDTKDLLVQDIAEGKFDTMEPQELHQTRPEHLEFPLTVFRGHIHQELRKNRERACWWPRLCPNCNVNSDDPPDDDDPPEEAHAAEPEAEEDGGDWHSWQCGSSTTAFKRLQMPRAAIAAPLLASLFLVEHNLKVI